MQSTFLASRAFGNTCERPHEFLAVFMEVDTTCTVGHISPTEPRSVVMSTRERFALARLRVETQRVPLCRLDRGLVERCAARPTPRGQDASARVAARAASESIALTLLCVLRVFTVASR